MFPFKVTSGYRCPDYNEQVGHPTSAHMKGRAVDIACNASQAAVLAREVMTLTHVGSLGLKQHGPYEGRYAHLDNVQRQHGPVIFTYE